ncbi:MAG: hypothetical protein P4L16_05570 [Chlamydiales bacterium]|nr:hypothetical protein [Chlamydiales bacterium]
MQLEYLDLNKRGLIPGPSENAETFKNRVSTTLLLKKELTEKKEALPIEGNSFEEALTITEQLYDIRPDWLPAFYSNKGLMFFEGGATWITKEGLPLIHLRSSFKKKKCLLGIYHEKELLAHEMIHATRSAFSEPIFEEFFAYKTSNKSYRAFLGTLLRSPMEAYLFLGTLWLSCIFLFFGFLEPMLLPLGLVSFALIRSIKCKNAYNKAKMALMQIFKEEKTVNAILFRLTDKEILLFSKISSTKILSYIIKEPSLRWQIMRAFYLH